MNAALISRDCKGYIILLHEYHKTFKPPPLPEDLMILTYELINKISNANKWKNYTENWKETMQDLAIDLIMRYAYNCNGKNLTTYYSKIIENAFREAIKRLKSGTKELNNMEEQDGE